MYFMWSHDGKYFARLNEDAIQVHVCAINSSLCAINSSKYFARLNEDAIQVHVHIWKRTASTHINTCWEYSHLVMM